MPPAEEPLAEYESLRRECGLAECAGRTLIEVRGADRASWLHNLATNNIRDLAANRGLETFFTQVQGKIVGHGLVLHEGERLVVDTVPGQAERLLRHLEKYHITEQVELRDRTAEWGELLLAGADTPERLKAWCSQELPSERLMGISFGSAEDPLWLWRFGELGAESFLLRGPREAIAAAREELTKLGVRPCSAEAVEMLRIEQGWPLYGIDISEANLPQEVARDAAAISFTSGCYLGQETVARIDALGHVNRTLVGIALEGSEIPPAGTEFSQSGKVVGAVTSAAWSPKLEKPLALAYVRRGSNTPGVELDSAFGAGRVVRLPVE